MARTDEGCAPNFARIFLWLSNRASDGDPVALANLAAVYLATEWTTPDVQQHLFWLRAAAAKGDAVSVAKLADYYDVGLIVPLDRGQALTLRRAAADAGLAEAQYKLGTQYDEGDGVARDPANAAHWYRLAGDQNHAAALVALSTLLFNGYPGAPADVPAAVECLRRAADLGDSEALAQLADSYYRGDLGQEDDAKAFELYKAAAQKGHAHATMMVGWFYVKGSPVPQDFAEARRWYELAAAKGDAEAMRRMSYLYRDALDVPQDLPKAFEWMERAARTGEETAQIELAQLLHAGSGIERDDEEAAHWLQLAADAGSDMAHAELGEYYLHGYGVAESHPEALRHFLIAARTQGIAEVSPWARVAAFDGPPANRPRIEQIVHEACNEPDLMNMKGALPEVCLMIMEHLPPNPTTAADMKSLLNRMQQSARPQSFIALATHAFLGWGMPYDLTLARSMARAAAADSPADSTRMLAAIDSIAADSPAARQQARDLLRHLADGGDNEAARLVAYRAMTGIGEELDPDAARKYDQIALQTSSLTARQREGAEHYLSSLCHPPPRESEIAERIARLGPRSGDTPVAVVYRMPPSYPVDLRSAGIEGSAEVAFVVDQSGHARDVTCPSSTHPYFARAAESAIRQWRFAPALKDGQPVATSLRQTIQFNLSGSDAKSPSTHSAP